MVKRTVPYNVKDVFVKHTYESDGYTLPYLLYVPKSYDCGEMYPLMIFLHGAGERGDDNQAQLVHGLQSMFDDPTSPVYDSIIIAPQCPVNSQWVLTPWAEGNYLIYNTPESKELESVCAVMDEITDCYNVDTDRVYITGLSMGGFGTWDLLARHGARFAAGMPVCGLAVKTVRNGRSINLDSRRQRIYGKLWMLTQPLRRPVYQLRHYAGAVRKKLTKKK